MSTPTCELHVKCLKADEGLEKCHMPYFLAASHTSSSENTPTWYIDLMLSMVAKTLLCTMAPWPHLTYPSLTIWSWPSLLSPIMIIPSHWCSEFWHEEESSPAECKVVSDPALISRMQKLLLLLQHASKCPTDSHNGRQEVKCGVHSHSLNEDF